MSAPTKENTGLELRKNARGNLHLFHRGELIPTVEIVFHSGHATRGRIKVELLTQYIQVVDEHN